MLIHRSISCAGRIPTLVSLALLLSLSLFVVLTPMAQRSSLSFSFHKRDTSSLLNTRQQSPAVAASNGPAAVAPAAPSSPSSAPAVQAPSPSPVASIPAPSGTPKASVSSQEQPSAAQQTVAQSPSSQPTQQQTTEETRTPQTQTQSTSAAPIVQSGAPTTTKVTTSSTTVTASGSASTPSSKSSSKSAGATGTPSPSSGSTTGQQPGETVRADSVNAATATGFWANKGAVAGTFTIVILVLLCTFVVIACKIRRPRRRRNRRQHRQSPQRDRLPKVEPLSEKQGSIPTIGSITGIANAVEDPEPGMADLTSQVPMSAYPPPGVNYGAYATQQETYQYYSDHAVPDDHRKSQAVEDLYDAYGGYENASAPARQSYSHPHNIHATTHSTYAPAHPYSNPRHSAIVNQAPQVHVSHYDDDHDPYYGNAPSGHAL